MSKTSQRIKEKALELFNEQGVEVITTRHVASALKMSQGNLHYHFSGRNELIMSLFRDFQEELSRQQVFRGQAFTLEDLKRSIDTHFELMWRYRFLLRDREVVWRRLPIVARETGVFIWKSKRRVSVLLEQMQEAGWIEWTSKGQRFAFVEAQLVFILGWLHAERFSLLAGNAFVHHQADVFLRMWVQLLLPEFRVKWEKTLL